MRTCRSCQRPTTRRGTAVGEAGGKTAVRVRTTVAGAVGLPSTATRGGIVGVGKVALVGKLVTVAEGTPLATLRRGARVAVGRSAVGRAASGLACASTSPTRSAKATETIDGATHRKRDLYRWAIAPPRRSMRATPLWGRYAALGIAGCSSLWRGRGLPPVRGLPRSSGHRRGEHAISAGRRPPGRSRR